MQYLGGKTRLANEIRDAILGHTDKRARYIEPMIGGGSTFFAIAPAFESSICGDIQEDLMLLYNALLDGWSPPDEVTEDEWRKLRDSEPSALRGFAGFACSFGGRFFEGYARGRQTTINFAAQGKKKLLKQLSQVNPSTVQTYTGPYWEAPVNPGDVVYLDPPYFGTKQYNSKRSGVPTFNHEEFWEVARKWRSEGADVFVSEFSAPEDWTAVWEKERSVSVAKHDVSTIRRGVDRLFR